MHRTCFLEIDLWSSNEGYRPLFFNEGGRFALKWFKWKLKRRLAIKKIIKRCHLAFLELFYQRVNCLWMEKSVLVEISIPPCRRTGPCRRSQWWPCASSRPEQTLTSSLSCRCRRSTWRRRGGRWSWGRWWWWSRWGRRWPRRREQRGRSPRRERSWNFGRRLVSIQKLVKSIEN